MHFKTVLDLDCSLPKLGLSNSGQFYVINMARRGVVGIEGRLIKG